MTRLSTALLLTAFLASCSVHPRSEPATRGWETGFVERELLTGRLLIVDVHYRPRKPEWCYRFETERAAGKFCATTDLGYEAGDVLNLTLEGSSE